MKIKILLILILAHFSFFVYPQEGTKKEVFNSLLIQETNRYQSSPFLLKAVSFFEKEIWDSTLVYTMKQLNVSKSDTLLNDYAHYMRAYSFKEKKLFEEAKKEFKVISEKFEFAPLTSMHLGEVSLELNEFENATNYYKRLLTLSNKSYKYISKSKVFLNLGLCYFHMGELEKAERYLIENVALNEQNNDTLGMVAAYVNVANLYYEQYKDDVAIPYFEKAYQLSKNTKSLENKRVVALNMAVVEENRKNFKKALAYRKEYETWKDSLNDQNKIYEVAQIEKEFAVQQKQKEVSLLQAENKAKVNERNGLLYSALILLTLLGITFYFYKEKIKTNKIIVAQKEDLDALNATKDKLFSIVSHDLRSSVNALKTSNTKLLDNLRAKNIEALEDLVQNNSGIVNGAYNLLDNLLHWALLQTKQSYFEIEALRLFFIVEQVAYNYKPIMLDKNIAFESNISKRDVVFADQESLKIILRNILDNAIKFTNSNGKIKIYTAHPNDTYCSLIIEDSGIGMSETKVEELLKDAPLLSKKENEAIIGTGLGLQLCKSMIQKNNGVFSIESELGKGTKMIVSLPKTKLNG